jgi:hypothetical protein
VAVELWKNSVSFYAVKVPFYKSVNFDLDFDVRDYVQIWDPEQSGSATTRIQIVPWILIRIRLKGWIRIWNTAFKIKFKILNIACLGETLPPHLSPFVGERRVGDYIPPEEKQLDTSTTTDNMLDQEEEEEEMSDNTEASHCVLDSIIIG